MHIAEWRRRARHGFANIGQPAGRRGPPDGLVVQAFKMVEHVVEHMMAISPKVSPIDGIKRRGTAGIRHGSISSTEATSSAVTGSYSRGVNSWLTARRRSGQSSGAAAW